MTLAEHLEKIKMKPGAFQTKHNIPHPYVYRWLSGMIPDKKWMTVLKEATKGKVTADSFYENN